ncbi:GreA/GreB family elongation factor [Piscinibacter sakaiensis]|uniref:Regulator of nucleoside diphosphate kinase n=1 Tax=Piscinibacter sakaiensis TaxID=1547922 RepID=A0A0K8P6R3_PISS1|nr:GreA/GreB family elongation factor [Piscinibacter sakaiensis]GAP38348.1 regulator of nucleoside diphosphate kinase [Piscinibacter sakaiensis]
MSRPAMARVPDERTLTELDHVRLLRLLGRDPHADAPTAAHDSLEEVLDASTLQPARAVEPDLVTMGSRLELQDLATAQRSELTLSYPADADPANGRISVLSPVGCAVLGLRVGGTARWRTPSGETRAAAVVAVHFQPEASGQLEL